ncbi:uncharacterized protein [Rutidosis leptorrhynchoides]|uniref:uncharacterized protein n=1 Tax=Rutidosis leptorrhynchoides TaxID=125765 RepID=UPI003A99E6B3
MNAAIEEAFEAIHINHHGEGGDSNGGHGSNTKGHLPRGMYRQMPVPTDGQSTSNSIIGSKECSRSSERREEELYEYGKKLGLKWPDGKQVERPDVFAIQETKSSRVSNQWESFFMVFCRRRVFIAIKDVWKANNCETIVVNVYGPHDDTSKMRMWDSLDSLMRNIDSCWLLCGDFNEVRDEDERFNSVFIPSRAKKFNDFINDNGLVEVPLGSRKFTRICDNGVKMSKLDRFLASDSFLNVWNDLLALVLGRKFSDHCPIVIRDKNVEVHVSRRDCVFRNKLKNVKSALREWSKTNFNNIDKEVSELKEKVCTWELLAENRSISDQETKEWMDCRKLWLDMERAKANMLKQKARDRWIVEGDGNSRFFHSVIKRNYNKNNVKGLIINSIWNENAMEIKEAMKEHFRIRFEKRSGNRPSMCNFQYPVISEVEAKSLEERLSESEILEALKDCDGNKHLDPMVLT